MLHGITVLFKIQPTVPNFDALGANVAEEAAKVSSGRNRSFHRWAAACPLGRNVSVDEGLVFRRKPEPHAGPLRSRLGQVAEGDTALAAVTLLD
jgi:hypothetical protein